MIFGIALLSGAAVAYVYLKLLWMTVRRLYASEHRNLLLLVSFLVRMLVLSIVFFLFLRQGGWYAVICFAGFWIVRQWMIRSTVHENKRSIKQQVSGANQMQKT